MVDIIELVVSRRMFAFPALPADPFVPAVNVRRDQCEYDAGRRHACLRRLADSDIRLAADHVIYAAAALVKRQRQPQGLLVEAGGARQIVRVQECDL